ncbi:MAG: PAS domain S-box protein [Chloroflexota bacterium]
MSIESGRRLPTLFHRIAAAAGVTTGVIGGLVLAGWYYDISPLKSILPGLETMKANTALAFLLGGLALLLENGEASGRVRQIAGGICSAIIAALGLLTLGEYVFGANLGIDQFLFVDSQTLATSFPGRMSIASALIFALLGVSLLLLDVENSHKFRPAQWLALAGGAIASIALIGYLYGVESLYSVGPYSSMALHTAFASGLLAIGILCARPKNGLMAIAVSEGAGGILLRRVMLLTIFIPAGLGWLNLAGQRAGLYDSNFGLALMVLGSVGTLAFILWSNTHRLDRVDESRRRSEEMYQESRLHWAGIVNSAMDAIISIDEDQRILAFNPAAESLFYYEPGQVIGRPVTILMPERFRKVHEGHVRAFGETAVTKRFMGRLGMVYGMRANGEEFPLEVSISQVKVGEKKIFTAILRDITERAASEEAVRKSEERFAKAFRASPDAIIISRLSDGQIIEVNDGWEILFGYESAEVLGRASVELNVFGDPQDRRRAIGRMQEQGYLRDFELDIRRKSGEIRRASISAEKIEINNAECLLTILRDVTERKNAEEEIRRLNAELEQRIQLRTSQLEAANKELEAFSYSVSHDLRAPLRAIDGFSRILLEDYASTLESEAQRYLNLVRDNTQQMGLLIEDLLAFARLSRQIPQMQIVAPEKLVRDALAELREEQKGRQVKIEIRDLPACQGDPALLRQAFVNLLANALKFTRRRVVAEIEVGCKAIGGQPVYYVKDNGAGFDMKYADKLFGVFQRLHRAEEYEGTGVGLAIIQRVVHRHGGRVWAEGEVDRGAAFYFTLPSAEGKQPKRVLLPAERLAQRAKELV